MKLRFIKKEQEVKDVYSFYFEPEEAVEWQPGQYMHYVLDLENVDDKGNERWFTISTAPFEKTIRITTRLDNLPVSMFKHRLMELEEGQEIEADGPKGKFVMREGAHMHIMIAGGIGITPFRSMLAQLAHDAKPANAALMYANRDLEFVFDQELAGFAEQDKTISIKKFTGKRIDKSDLEEYAKDSSAVFYLSGPEAMVDSYEEVLKDLDVSPDNIATDYFPGY
jgi:ferredoxin-NADP reductase